MNDVFCLMCDIAGFLRQVPEPILDALCQFVALAVNFFDYVLDVAGCILEVAGCFLGLCVEFLAEFVDLIPGSPCNLRCGIFHLVQHVGDVLLDFKGHLPEHVDNFTYRSDERLEFFPDFESEIFGFCFQLVDELDQPSLKLSEQVFKELFQRIVVRDVGIDVVEYAHYPPDKLLCIVHGLDRIEFPEVIDRIGEELGHPFPVEDGQPDRIAETAYGLQLALQYSRDVQRLELYIYGGYRCQSDACDLLSDLQLVLDCGYGFLSALAYVLCRAVDLAFSFPYRRLCIVQQLLDIPRQGEVYLLFLQYSEKIQNGVGYGQSVR